MLFLCCARDSFCTHSSFLVASRRVRVYIHPKIHSDMEANYLNYDVIIGDYVYLYVCLVFLLGNAE